MSIPAVDDRGPSTEPNAHFADSSPAPASSGPSSIDNAPYKLLYERWKMEAAKVERLSEDLRIAAAVRDEFHRILMQLQSSTTHTSHE